MTKLRRRLRSALVLSIVGAALSAIPARAQEVIKVLNRSFNQCDYPAPYVYDYEIFTATGPEAMLTFSRTHTSCSDRCQTVPGGDNSCNHACRWDDRACPNNWKCGACIGFGCAGQCVGGVDVNVGYVVVLKSSRFCSIAACTGTIPLVCPPSSSCDGSGTCSDATSTARDLCLCPDPACPIGQHICSSLRPAIPAADLDYEAFSAAANPAWVLGQATITNDVLGLNGTVNISSLAQVRFPTVPGEEYAILIKWSIYPVVSAFQSCPDAALLMSLDTRPDSCGP